MKKLITLLFIIFISLTNFSQNTNAVEINIKENTLETKQDISEKITTEYIFMYFADFFNKTPDSYKYIKLNFKNISKGSALEQSLQKLVYHNKIKNSSSNIRYNKTLNAYIFYKLSEKILSIEMTLDKTSLSNRNVDFKDLNFIRNTYNQNNKIYTPTTSYNSKNTLGEKQEIFDDVYKTIINSHYDKKDLDKEKIIDSAIKGLTEGTGDIHTVYFPPIDSKNFNDDLQGEYEGIGSYVEMVTPGELKITSPIPGGPAEKAGLKGGDLIIKIDGKEVTQNNSLKELISWIKGPAGTEVELTIKRKEKEIKIKVIREKIIIKSIEYKRINSKTYYLQLKSFGNGISNEFKLVLEEIKEHPTTNKIIIDLRNNGGGYLTEVTEMLSYVIPKGDPTAVVKYNQNEKIYYSKGYNLIDLNKYEIVILQNSGTASASEIMIGTMKDYFKTTTIGEKTYGKGSVQTIKNYNDGSSFKYTIAKWFTGKTQTGIDGIGIEPDIKLELDIESYQYNGKDNQLNKAIYK